MKPKQSSAIDQDIGVSGDYFETPGYAIKPLLPYLDDAWNIWEPACGKRAIVDYLRDNNYDCFGTDQMYGINFLKDRISIPFDAIVTNPPWSTKYHFIRRAYQYNVPWAMLVPVETIGSGEFQGMAWHYGMQILLLNRRIKFRHMKWENDRKSNPQMPVLWLCHRMLPESICYGCVEYDDE